MLTTGFDRNLAQYLASEFSENHEIIVVIRPSSKTSNKGAKNLLKAETL